MLRYFLILSLFVSSCAKTQHHKRKRKFVSTFGAETELHRSHLDAIKKMKDIVNCADSNNLIKEHIKSITGIDGFCIFGDAAFCERAFNYIWWNQTASFDEKPSCYPPDLLTTIIAGYTSDDIFDKEKTYCDTTGDPENTGDLEWTNSLTTPSETCMCPHLAIIETCTVDI